MIKKVTKDFQRMYCDKRIKQTSKLRKLFEIPGFIITPGAYDALSAKLIEKTGFEVIQHLLL